MSGWLASCDWRSAEEVRLACLAGDLCASLSRGQRVPPSIRYAQLHAPSTDVLSILPRDELLKWYGAGEFHRCADFDVVYSEADAAQFLGALALSYANLYDLPAVSAIVRKAAMHGMVGFGLRRAYSFICDQQQPDGYFGFFSGLDACERHGRGLSTDRFASLQLTVDALSAIRGYRAIEINSTRHQQRRSGPK